MLIPTPDEVRRSIEAAHQHFQAFIAVAAFAGLRLSEAAGLQLSDVDFLRRTVTVHRQVQGQTKNTAIVVPPKYGSERTIHVAQQLIEMLAAHIQEIGVWGEDQWLFGNGTALFHRNSAGSQWRHARDVAGIPGHFTLHDLRHFYASGLISQGCDVVTVQRALGHSSPSITLDTYSHLWPDADDKTRAAGAALMNEVFADSVRTASEQSGSD